MERALRVLAPHARYSLLADGAVLPAFGVLGGCSGLPVGAWIDRNGSREAFATPGKVAGHPLSRGNVVIVRSAGGGGYGDPLERDAERVANDVAEGYVSTHAARDTYGLVLAGSGIDAEATAELRRRLKAARLRLATRLALDVFEPGAVSRRRICRMNPADAGSAGIGAADLVELDSGRAAPLRAWAQLEPSVEAGFVHIDQRGLSILQARPGEQVTVRPLVPPA